MTQSPFASRQQPPFKKGQEEVRSWR